LNIGRQVGLRPDNCRSVPASKSNPSPRQKAECSLAHLAAAA